MRYLMIFFIIFLAFFSLNSQVLQAEVLDRIVAVVNDEPITKSELDTLLAPIYEQYKLAYKGKEFIAKINEARTNILNQLIEDKLVAQEAERLGVEVREEEIDAQIDEIKKKFASDKDFRAYLEAQNITMTKLRDKFKEQISIRKLHQFEIMQKVVVSPKEIEDYYNKHLRDFSTKEKAKVRTIMIRKSDMAKLSKNLSSSNISKDENGDIIDPSLEKARKILKELKNGASFVEYAKEYSEGQNQEGGGDLGFVKRGELIKKFDDVIFSMPVGSISDVIESPIGYHIFLVEAKQEKKTKPLEEIKDEIHNILFKEKTKNRFKEWMQKLKEKSYISIK